MGTLAVFTQADLTVTYLRCLPVACLTVLVFAYGVAWGLPTIIMVEMLNFEVSFDIIRKYLNSFQHALFVPLSLTYTHYIQFSHYKLVKG